MRHASLDELLAPYSSERVIELVAPYLTQARRDRIESVLAGRVDGVHVAIESPTDPHNAAAIVRTAEALGVLGVHVIEAEGDALHAKKTTQGAYHWVETRHHGTFDTFLAEVGAGDMMLAGAWMDAPMAVTELSVDRPLCLLFGNESRGLSPRAREACSTGFRIEMFGMSESLNLSVSAAISLHEVLRRRRVVAGRSDLRPERRDALRARYYARSIDRRFLQGLLSSLEESHR